MCSCNMDTADDEPDFSPSTPEEDAEARQYNEACAILRRDVAAAEAAKVTAAQVRRALLDAGVVLVVPPLPGRVLRSPRNH